MKSRGSKKNVEDMAALLEAIAASLAAPKTGLAPLTADIRGVALSPEIARLLKAAYQSEKQSANAKKKAKTPMGLYIEDPSKVSRTFNKATNKFTFKVKDTDSTQIVERDSYRKAVSRARRKR